MTTTFTGHAPVNGVNRKWEKLTDEQQEETKKKKTNKLPSHKNDASLRLIQDQQGATTYKYAQSGWMLLKLNIFFKN